ncbi:DUF910 family protein [Gracilibacillus sp. S3-1-1]|uniref:DUF910 family protein n=1 Tax=Gracilibacillus pellucidus TaxID=3095368 RepID=A0ACC6M4V9_9BACI|nr:YqgQ family protein [Gracilibacillus sp. S3-1-1]MDX8045990.1 DUF910 family protein [Gracilibacillus sp. S3-1-1]
MKNLYELRKFLLKFGTIIYIGDPLADLELMEEEMNELYQVNLITQDQFIQAKLIITREKEKLVKG